MPDGHFLALLATSLHEHLADSTLANAILDRLVQRAYKIGLHGESM